MLRLSVVILTKNEEANISECLESVRWADEIVIIDDFSIDRTLALCSPYTPSIYQEKMSGGFGRQRQLGMDRARGEWVLFLDADERVPEALKNEILEAIGDPTQKYNGFMMPKRTFYLGKEIRHCGWSQPVLRLFRRDKAKSDGRSVHESILVEPPVGELKNPHLHYSYRSLAQHLEKMRRYTDLEAEEFFRQGVRIAPLNAPWYLVAKPLLAFVRKYFLMKGFLDGKEGFYISFFTGLVVFLNYAKLWKRQCRREG